ncbi:MAG: hypothetical protein ACI836_001628 [Saprospiraceae bacterium]|jgi:hypothetical protein
MVCLNGHLRFVYTLLMGISYYKYNPKDKLNTEFFARSPSESAVLSKTEVNPLEYRALIKKS